ncbi:MAG: hypothetical protein RR843_06470 [Clostridia bacterium]
MAEVKVGQAGASGKRRKLTTEGFLGILIIAILIALYFCAGGTSGFYSLQNIMNILRVFSYLFIAGIGMTMIIITGNIDISFGAVISVIAIVMAAISKIDKGINVWMFLPAGIVVGAILCGFNAWMMAKFKIPSMVITLATTQIYYGALLLLLEGSIGGDGACALDHFGVVFQVFQVREAALRDRQQQARRDLRGHQRGPHDDHRLCDRGRVARL